MQIVDMEGKTHTVDMKHFMYARVIRRRHKLIVKVLFMHHQDIFCTTEQYNLFIHMYNLKEGLKS